VSPWSPIYHVATVEAGRRKGGHYEASRSDDQLSRHHSSQRSERRGAAFSRSLEKFGRSGGDTALDLVNQAAAVLMSLEVQAAATHNLARDAAEKLQVAERQIESLQTERRAAEQKMREMSARAEQAEEALKDAQSRTLAAEAEVYATEQRLRLAETRADEAQQALARVEDAIRSKLLDLHRTKLSQNAARLSGC
jgi:chromosome segregation ATPase